MARARFFLRLLLFAAALAASAWAVVELRDVRAAVAPLRPGNFNGLAAPLLERNAPEAKHLLKEWEQAAGSRRRVQEIARDALGADAEFIRAYLTAGLLILIFGAVVAHPCLTAAALTLASLFGLALVDMRENAALGAIFDAGSSVGDELIVNARKTTMIKLALTLTTAVGLVGLIGASLRSLFASRVGETVHPSTFEQLIGEETKRLFAAVANRPVDEPRSQVHTAADEPRVVFRAADVIGLALSGGGIRSATFNLGLLQGLHERNLLPLFDYVSTVSGGGYIGSFWSEWLARHRANPEDRSHNLPDSHLFPWPQGDHPSSFGRVDSPQVRHLREFAGFLAPRWGFFEVETWTAIVALLSGLIPAIAIGLSVIGLGLLAWLALTIPLALESWYWPVLAIVVVTAATLFAFESAWWNVKAESAGRPAEPTMETTQLRRSLVWYFVFALIALVLTGVVQAWLPALYGAPGGFLLLTNTWRAVEGERFEQWWALTGIDQSFSFAWVLSPRLFDYALVWFGVGLVLIVARLTYALWPSRWSRETLAAYDRVLMRLLGLASFWAGIAIVWHVITNTSRITEVVTGAILSGTAFAALRNWMGIGLRRPQDASPTTRLKPYLPALLAYVTIILTTVAVGRLLIGVGGVDWMAWWTTASVMASITVLALFINPGAYGLHVFYRERLTRAFAGACNLKDDKAEDNRSTEPRSGDDRDMSTLVDRPLHLVCCAANDLSGDTVETLGRGARSAVLSKYGLSIGNHWNPKTDVTLGAAITASAAAFNSNMGMVSQRVGPAVAFLMTALNLRLGLWLRHPAAPMAGRRRWPGLLLYREMFGLTSASGQIRGGQVPTLLRDVHLSDGGHFENLALYELVRRHCRYILVSDCVSDPTVAFDDLGNAIRRIREDFGVDISIDIETLRPAGATKTSRQHVAVGTIHYSSRDRGILVYIKPTLTGDEPGDVLQYKARNDAFPHESTGDQFYDEAQYEAYRRLGVHVADTVFGFIPPNPAAEPGSGGGVVSANAPVTRRPLTADWVFAETLHKWRFTPPDLVQKVLSMTSRLGEIEIELQRPENQHIVRELVPELNMVEPRRSLIEPPGGPHATVHNLALLVRMAQVMEDTWIACQLDDYWDHPLNLGWVNLFARWATAPSFRFWWPLFAPMYSPGFRRFIDERFPIPAGNTTHGAAPINVPQRGRVVPLDRLATGGRPMGLAEVWWKLRSTQRCEWTGKRVFQNLITLPVVGGDGVDIQTGLVAITFGEDIGAGRDVAWTTDDFFVPPSLWGAGIGWYFLKNVLNRLSSELDTQCYVVIKAVPHDAQHRIALDDVRAFSEQYRKIGFRQQDPETLRRTLPNGKILAALNFNPYEDTLYELNLALWRKRRD